MSIENLSSQTKNTTTILLNCFINDNEIVLEVPATYRLVDILRKKLDLTGTKISCEVGRCGACSVLMNGNLVNSCLLMAYQIQGSSINTIEYMSKESMNPIQQAFLEEGALQCGYCTPGMVMALKSLLSTNPSPSLEEIEIALSGNLCRCTGYNGIIRAVSRYIENSQSS
ncbi:(2Fe-2S)-binding protein [Litchfieldia alkalitelluris]|uniref:(2Fe-2S)-binding protein n=1 Tax=Litchfieldia alkalitelluris TaxID=304268 RepID=UPI000995E9CE|nr:(2Fe-2S)-binding protein [Litchfieldia alkalitelluris]